MVGAIMNIIQLKAAELELQQAKDVADRVIGVLIADADHFKKINDTYGHLTSDTVLREVASRIVQSIRLYDGAGRYGGEEFLVVLPAFDKTNIEQSTNRIRLAIASTPIPVAGSKIPVTASIGATSIDARGCSERQALFNADKAL